MRQRLFIVTIMIGIVAILASFLYLGSLEHSRGGHRDAKSLCSNSVSHSDRRETSAPRDPVQRQRRPGESEGFARLAEVRGRIQTGEAFPAYLDDLISIETEIRLMPEGDTGAVRLRLESIIQDPGENPFFRGLATLLYARCFPSRARLAIRDLLARADTPDFAGCSAILALAVDPSVDATDFWSSLDRFFAGDSLASPKWREDERIRKIHTFAKGLPRGLKVIDDPVDALHARAWLEVCRIRLGLDERLHPLGGHGSFVMELKQLLRSSDEELGSWVVEHASPPDLDRLPESFRVLLVTRVAAEDSTSQNVFTVLTKEMERQSPSELVVTAAVRSMARGSIPSAEVQIESRFFATSAQLRQAMLEGMRGATRSFSRMLERVLAIESDESVLLKTLEILDAREIRAWDEGSRRRLIIGLSELRKRSPHESVRSATARLLETLE